MFFIINIEQIHFISFSVSFFLHSDLYIFYFTIHKYVYRLHFRVYEKKTAFTSSLFLAHSHTHYVEFLSISFTGI